MQREVVIDKALGAEDIIPHFAGYEQCAPCHSFGPFVRTMYLIHYCLSGRGVLHDKYGTHEVHAGELFVIRPCEITTYTADAEEPWHYVWIAFSGKRGELFSKERSVYPCPNGIFQRMRNLIDAEENAYDIYTALIYEILYELFSSGRHKQDTLSQIRRYIRYNYMRNISAESVCDFFGYERTYLYRIFKKRYGMGIKDYITKVRMEHAHAFLLEGNSVTNVAAMTGYHDKYNFSKAYKKYYGYAPSHTR